MTAHAEGKKDRLQNEIREADENTAGHAKEQIPPAGLRAERNGHQHHDKACPRRGQSPVKFGLDHVGIVRRQAGIVPQIFPQFGQRDVRAARAAQGLRVAELEQEKNFFRRLVKFRQRQQVGGRRRHQIAVQAGLREQLRVGKSPDAVGADGPRGLQNPPGTVRQGPRHIGIDHRGGGGVIFAELPYAMGADIAEAALDEPHFAGRAVFRFHMARQNLIGPAEAERHGDFVQRKIKARGRQPDDKIWRAQPPQPDAGGAQRGDFVVPRVVRERIKQRQQQQNRQDEDKKFRQTGGAIFRRVEQRQFFLLNRLHFLEEKK